MTLTLATLFSGGEGVGVGARMLGVLPLWGIEYDVDIADVAMLNDFHPLVADVRNVAFDALPRPDILHASPPCPAFSSANVKRGETETDRALAAAVARAIMTLRPRVFTLENVSFYAKSDSFRIIARALDALDYHIEMHVLDAADFGVPQRRVRLFVVARRASWLLPPLALRAQRRIGWYDAVHDLIPSFPAWTPTENQLRRLRRIAFAPPALFGNRYQRTVFPARRPAQTITTKADLCVILPDSSMRRLTPRAAARLQSFPDDYALPPIPSLAWRVVGNAVPPRLYARLLAAAIPSLAPAEPTVEAIEAIV